MTRDEIIKMAREAGFETKNGMVWVDQWEVTRSMERIVLSAYAAGAAAEREAICPIVYGHCGSDNDAQRIVDAIRARSAK